VPIFKDFATKAMESIPVVPFRGAPGIRMVRIDRASGRRVFGAWPSDDPEASVIWEAFKPSSEPVRSMRRDEQAATAKAQTAKHVAGKRTENAAAVDAFQNKDGIY